MSDTAPKHFADIASALGPLLDNYKIEKANQTLLTLFDLGEQLPQSSSIRKVINSQITHILASDFPINPDTTNKTMVIIGQLKDALEPNDPANAKFEDQIARILAFKLEKLNARGGGSTSSSSNSQSAATPVPTPSPAPTVQSRPEPKPQAVDAPQATPQPAKVEDKPADAPPARDEYASLAHEIQLSLDQMSEATRKAFAEFEPIYEHGGTVKAYVEYLKSQPAKDGTNIVKIELDKLRVLIEKIESAPAEADQFQVLYDQVDAKHKDPKTGVFSIFQRDYGGNARRFVVERTAQYAKYVPAAESRQRMIEDLHKLIEQAQKNLAEGPAKPASGAAGDNKNGSNGRSFFHG